MHSTAILIIFAVISLSTSFLLNQTLFNGYPPLCSELNTTMYERIDKILKMPQSTNVVKSRPKRALNQYKLSFNNLFVNDKNLSFSIILPKGYNLKYLKDNKFPNYTPLSYNITVFHFLPFPTELNFVLIEGKRCKYKFNGKINQYEAFKCWEKPSFCQGSIEACLVNDDEDSLCYDEISKRGERVQSSSDSSLPNVAGKVFLEHLDFTHYYVLNDGRVNFKTDIFYYWDCEEMKDKLGFCELFAFSWYKYDLKSLKTLSGYP